MCRVLNKHHVGIPAGAVYIGRGSKWGNPFRINCDGERAAVIAKHERWLADQIICCGRSMKCTDAISCASARRAPATAISWLGLANATRDARIAWWRAVRAAA